MIAKRILHRRGIWRWSLPLAALVVIALVGSGVLSAGASPNLPNLTAAQLLADVEQSNVAGFSGQLVENASLGLPQLPDLGGNSSSSTSLVSLLSGSHTARVWYAGPTKQRFALLGTLGETDVFHDGTNLWEWDSDSLTAVHTTLPAAAADQTPTTTRVPETPQQLAAAAIKAIDPSTIVTTDESRQIAGRAAYDLVLSPRDTSSRVGSVRVGIDAQYKMPLSVQVYPRGDSANAAIDVSFTSIDFAVPGDSEFAFTPPASAKVTQQSFDGMLGGHDGHGSVGGRAGQVESAAASSTRVYGHGWTSVIRLPGTDSLSATGSQVPLGSLTPVSGSWGTGRLFSSALISALFVDGGDTYVGAVDPSVLYTAAAQK